MSNAQRVTGMESSVALGDRARNRCRDLMASALQQAALAKNSNEPTAIPSFARLSNTFRIQNLCLWMLHGSNSDSVVLKSAVSIPSPSQANEQLLHSKPVLDRINISQSNVTLAASMGLRK